MTDSPASSASALPAASVEPRRGIPLVWVIPLVALLIGAWLVYTTFAEKGPTITITFATASGIEPDKTAIKYRDVEVGLVSAVALSPDLAHVVVTAEMEKDIAGELNDMTEFWVVQPRLTASGVSGLGTLVSGTYIGMRPGTGAARRRFEGLPEPPVLDVDVPGKHILLQSETLGSVGPGSGVYFRGIQVGEVLGYRLEDAGNRVEIQAFVRAPHDALIRDDTHFWNASGVDVSLSASGLDVRTESLQSVVTGGIAFETPREASAGEPSRDGAVFTLHTSYDAIAQARFTERVPYIVYFQGSVAGLEVGAPVVLRGLKIGEVTDITLELDVRSLDVRIPVRIEVQPQRVKPVGGSAGTMTPYQRMEKLVAHGARAQLRSGNLLTGQLLVALDFFPDSPAATVAYEQDIAVIPSVPSDIEQFTEKAKAFLDKLQKAPVPELVADLRRTVQDADRLLASPSLQQSVRELAPLIAGLNKTVEVARGTLTQADTTLQSASDALGPDSALRYDLALLLQELTETARSLRVLVDYLEREPNAVLFGKKPQGK